MYFHLCYNVTPWALSANCKIIFDVIDRYSETFFFLVQKLIFGRNKTACNIFTNCTLMVKI